MGASIGSLQKNVAAAGTAEALSSSKTEVLRVVIKALADNTGDIYVGGSDVSSSNGIVLDGGESVVLDASLLSGKSDTLNLQDIYIDAGTSSDGVSAIYIY